MINGILESLKNDQALLEEENLLFEAANDDVDDEKIMDIEDTVISPSEKKKLDTVLKNIPESIDNDEKITKSDIKKANDVADPSVKELVKESFDVTALAQSLMNGGN